MPFTPYHFGPSGFVGLVFRRWIDLPVFLLANVVIDVEVLFAPGWPPHRHWHWHTLLVGGLVGLACGAAAYPLRNLFKEIMRLLRIPYKPRFWKMVLSGVLGAWLHVLIDGIYHYDVQVFWPNTKMSLWRMARGYVSQGQIQAICAAFIVAAVILYIFTVKASSKKNKGGGKTPRRQRG